MGCDKYVVAKMKMKVNEKKEGKMKRIMFVAVALFWLIEGVCLASSNCTKLTSYDGSEVHMVGDVNGDGIGDMLICSDKYYLFFGKKEGFKTNVSLEEAADVVISDTSNLSYAIPFVAVGDLDKDGYSDFVVRSGGINNSMYIFYGKPAKRWIKRIGFLNADAILIGSTTKYPKLIEDLNGDGYPDIFTQEISDSSNVNLSYVNVIMNPGTRLRGKVKIGSYSGLFFTRGQTGSFVFESVASEPKISLGDTVLAGDFNGDGRKDILLTSALKIQGYDGEEHPDPYFGYIFWGGNFDDVKTTDFEFRKIEIESDVKLFADLENYDNSGVSLELPVVKSLDFNGDKISDICIGFPGVWTDVMYEGKVTILSGMKTWPLEIEGAITDNTFLGMDRDGYLGSCLTSAGDRNGDGCEDLLIGAPGEKDYAGVAYLLLGQKTSYGSNIPMQSVAYSYTEAMGNNNNSFAEGMNGNSDLNGDGQKDIVIVRGDPRIDGHYTPSGDHSDIYIYNFPDPIFEMPKENN
jgi:hypothetical protein